MTTEPDAVVAKPGHKWLRRLIVLALLAAAVAAYVSFHTQMRTLRLADGRKLYFLQSTLAAPYQDHALGAGTKERVLRAWGELQGNSSFTQPGASHRNDRDVPTVGFWFQFPGTWTPQDMQTTSIVFTDTNGWKHVGSTVQPYGAAGASTSGLLVQTPAFPNAGQRCRMEVVSNKGEVLGGLSLTQPEATKPHFAWSAAALPGTSTAGDLTVTLIRVVPTAPVASGSLTQSSDRSLLAAAYYGVSPEFTVQIAGAPSNDWIVATDDDWWQLRRHSAPLRNTYGERASLKTCNLSPFDDVWRLALPLVKQNAALSADERVSFTCDVPTEGVATEINEEQKIGAASIRLLGASGTGHSTATSEGARLFPGSHTWPVVDEQNCRVVMAWTAAMPPTPAGVSVSYSYGVQDPDSNLYDYLYCPGTMTLTIDSQVPMLSFSVSPWRFEHLRIDVVDDQGRLVPGSTFRILEFALWRPRQPLAAGTKSLTVQMSLQEPKQFEFFIAPPRDEIQKQLRDNEAQ